MQKGAIPSISNRKCCRYFLPPIVLLSQQALSLEMVSEDLLMMGIESPPAAAAPANPYVSGCLYHHNLTSQIRVCNSDDSAETVTAGLCRKPPASQHHDPEIRLLVQDFETSAFSSWIIQFILSELLDVPASTENGAATAQINFYNPQNKFLEIGFVYPEYKIALANAYNFKGDCAHARVKNKNHDDGDNEYVLCAHFVSEAWDARESKVMEMVKKGMVESPQGVGGIGQESWFVPKFTAEKDPSIISYFGLQGEENRPKLAARFKRPITWKYYCDHISLNNCTMPDTVAQRAPQDDKENGRMFANGLFTGYFQSTDKNDCELNPTTCTGHFVDYPCPWPSPVATQVHYMNIALDGDGNENNYMHSYSASQIDDIWRAANATKSDVMMYWYSPSLLYGEFLGTDYEFTRVNMPTPTQECKDYRLTTEERCLNDPVLQIGDERGICEEPPKSLHSVMVSNLRTAIEDPSIAEEVRSPAYDMLKRFQITELQLAEIFTKLHETNEPRQATCDWAAENIEYLRSFIPASYPRHFENKEANTAIMYASSIIGILVVLCVMLAAILLYRQQNCGLIRRLQVDFFWMSLCGLLFVAVGATVMAPPQSNGTCIAEIWLVNLGYTILLVPLMVKIDAINSVSHAAAHFKRMKISRVSLFRNGVAISSLVVIFLILWTCIDTPSIESEYQMLDYDNGIVAVSAYCSSQSSVWNYVSVGWVALLLFITSVLAFKMRKVQLEEFCETPTLMLMVYSHLVFILLRLTTYFLQSHVSEYVLSRARSLILSVDTLAALLIYFVPKIVASLYPDPERRESSLAVYRSSVMLTPSDANFSVVTKEQARLQKEYEECIAKLKEENRVLKRALNSRQDVVNSERRSSDVSSARSSQVAPVP